MLCATAFTLLIPIAVPASAATRLDELPGTAHPAGMGIVQGAAYLMLTCAVGVIWYRMFIARSIDASSLRMSVVFSIVAVLLHIVIIPYTRIWQDNEAVSGFARADIWKPDINTSATLAVVLLLVGLLLQHIASRRYTGTIISKLWVLLGGLIALGSFTVVGHTAPLTPTWMSHGADFAHGVAATAWVGGVFGLLWQIRQALRTAEQKNELIHAVHTFSRFALYAVLVLAISGGVMAFMIKDDLLDLTGTPFARALTLKLIVLLIPLVLAAWNRYRLIPLLKASADSEAPHEQLERVLLVEFIALVGILMITGTLVLRNPVA